MSFSRNTILSAVFALSSFAMVAQDAQACPPRGGGYSRGYSSYSYRRPSYSRYTPSYSHSYSQPVQVVRPVQPIVSQPVQQISQTQPLQPQLPLQQQLLLQPQQPVQQQLQPQQPVQPQLPLQQQRLQPQQTVQSQQQPVAPQQIQRQQPVQSQQVAPQQPAAPAPANPATMSALQALGGFAPPTQSQPAPQPQVQVPAHVGSWTATLGNGANVRLTLQNDGSFVWVATNQNGNASSFSGRYTVGNGSLTLNRNNDNQQLSGSMTTTGGNAFSFKLAGNNAAAINFSRS